MKKLQPQTEWTVDGMDAVIVTADDDLTADEGRAALHFDGCVMVCLELLPCEGPVPKGSKRRSGKKSKYHARALIHARGAAGYSGAIPRSDAADQHEQIRPGDWCHAGAHRRKWLDRAHRALLADTGGRRQLHAPIPGNSRMLLPRRRWHELRIDPAPRLQADQFRAGRTTPEPQARLMGREPCWRSQFSYGQARGHLRPAAAAAAAAR